MTALWIRLFVALLLAHLLADFILQSNTIAQKKEKWYWLGLHSLVHGLLTYALLAAWKLWWLPLVILGSHFLIDWVKTHLKRNPVWIFVLDQIFHVAILIALASFAQSSGAETPFWLAWMPTLTYPIAVVGCALILLLPCGGILIGLLTEPFQKQLESNYKKKQQEKDVSNKAVQIKGFDNGGRIIGYLERLLILVFILANQYAGIGFLVAAKSIFRFGELKENENRMEAEYIIIGTFASFLYAIVIGLGAAWLISL